MNFSIKISKEILFLIREKAEKLGYKNAIIEVLKFPDFPEEELKYHALRYFQQIPASFYEPYVVERAWLRAFEAVSKEKIQVSFPHLDPFVAG